MAIPESQLETWTGQGAASGSATTYQAVRQAIFSHSALTGRNLDVYLQGSYRNDTNIRGDSDVDVVVECRESQFSDPSRLQGANRQWWESLPTATYTWDEFRQDVHQALVAYFGPDQVRDGNKCIKVWEHAQGRIAADVVPAFTFVLYQPDLSSEEGIAFLTRDERRRVVNFPKQHYDNGVAKNSATQGTFKPAVRMFKNATTRAVDSGLLSDDDAPSHFIECAVANARNGSLLVPTWQEVFCGVHEFIRTSDLNTFMRLDGIRWLFGTDSESWSQDKCRRWLTALAQLWLTW